MRAPGRGIVAVAFSGGRDSTALLHATVAAARPLGIDVIALHVHHGLSADADAWLAHCAALCRRWARRGAALAFDSRGLDTGPGPGDSIEAWARQARYRALREMAVAAGTDVVLLGHHRRDQAETFLLQALRGGGVAALSAMPVSARRDGVTWARPWLDTPPAAIDAYARAHRLRWITDDSNADTRFARNRLRVEVWPALVGAFADAEVTLATAARWAQQASTVLDDQAAVDLAAIAGGDGEAFSIAPWRALPGARRAATLRAWLRRQSGRVPPASLIERLDLELPTAGSHHWPAPEGGLHSHRGVLRWQALPPKSRPMVPGPTRTADLRRPGLHPFPDWNGALRVGRVDSGGLPQALAAAVSLRARAPGDRFQAGPKRPPRRLKLQFQAAGIPDAGSRRGPVVCVDDVAVFVPGLGIDARVMAEPGEPQLAFTWITPIPAVKARAAR